MKNRFFVSAVRHIAFIYKIKGELRGDRFELKIVISSDQLDKNGFVLDFTTLERVLNRLENELKEKDANKLIGKDDFDFKSFLIFIREFVARHLKEPHILINEISLTNNEEGYIARFDS